MRTCEVDTPDGMCPRKHRAKGMCKAHYLRWWKDGDVRADVPFTRHTDDPAYTTVHKRLYIQRGRADERDCVDCGDEATQWSYGHDDPDERIDDRGFPYSDDLDRYDPRCKSCHTKFDLSLNDVLVDHTG